MKKTVKRTMCALLAAVSLATTGTTAFAGTIPFNVTVGGSGTQDPLSKREIKTADGDNYAYFTGHTFSKPNVGIYVKSCQRENSNIYTSEAYLSSSNAGVTQKRLCESSNRQNYGIRELLSVMQNGNYYGGRCILLP